MDHSRPNSVFEDRLNRLDQDALRQVARNISGMLLDEHALLHIEEEVRDELLTFGQDSDEINDKALLFWRTARIVQTRGLAPEAHANGETPFTRAVWNLLLQVDVRTTPGRTSLSDLAREAERARIEREARQRRHIGGSRGHGSSSHKKADVAGDIAEGATEGLLRSRSSSSSSSSSSSGGGGFDLDCCPDSLIVLLRATVKYRRFIR